MIRALFPGSFDPPTLGHIDIIERACILFDELIVLVAANTAKTGLFSPDERRALLDECVSMRPNVSVRICDTLVAAFARDVNCTVLIRGVRNPSDYSYEYELSRLNKHVNPSLETILFPADPRFIALSSSAIKELASYGGDVSSLVPPHVEAALRTKLVTNRPADKAR